MKHIIIGLGEVGKALREVLHVNPDNIVAWHDRDASAVAFSGRADAMHVAIPYSDEFVATVKSYILLYRPSVVIVHSSVPVGTCDNNYWVHSPVRGVHPNIADGIITFVKYFGGLRADEAADIFSACGVKTVAISHARDCEAAKLWDTTQYGLQIVLCKAIHAWCEEHGVDFEFAYKEFNRTYNEGYRELGRSEVVRPFLKHMDGPIGGHCVIQNLPLLGGNVITDMIKEFNNNLHALDLATSGDLP